MLLSFPAPPPLLSPYSLSPYIFPSHLSRAGAGHVRQRRTRVRRALPLPWRGEEKNKKLATRGSPVSSLLRRVRLSFCLSVLTVLRRYVVFARFARFAPGRATTSIHSLFVIRTLSHSLSNVKLLRPFHYFIPSIPQLVRHGVNGLVFEHSTQLAQQLLALLFVTPEPALGLFQQSSSQTLQEKIEAWQCAVRNSNSNNSINNSNSNNSNSINSNSGVAIPTPKTPILIRTPIRRALLELRREASSLESWKQNWDQVMPAFIGALL